MEVPPVEETKKLEEAKLTSAAAFVEGGIQESCDDACSICLEEFCESDPSTVTGCEHEFHLQCILEWCQRSSQCPMCWQPIGLKDPTSQELLDAVVQERNLRRNPPRNAAIFHHPTLGHFEIQHLPVGVNDAELEERIIQHLAAAAAMGRARDFSRREGHRGRSSNHDRPRFLVFSAQPPAHADPTSSASPDGGGNEPQTLISGASPSSPLIIGEQSVYTSGNQSTQSDLVSSPGPSAETNRYGTPPHNRRSPTLGSMNQEDRAGPSDFQSFSEALKSRFNAMSMRYKESISKSTRGWKERWFSRNSPVADLGSHVSRESDPGIPTVSHTMEHAETRDSDSSLDLAQSGSDGSAVLGPTEQEINERGIDFSGNRKNNTSPSGGNHLTEACKEMPFAASSGSS